MTEDLLYGLFIYCLVSFLIGEALGIWTCAICAGWFDKIMKDLAKKKKKRAADAGTSTASPEPGGKD